MKQFFRELLPGYSLPSVVARGSLEVTRDRILQTLLLGLLAMALPIIYLATEAVIRVNKWGLAVHLYWVLWHLVIDYSQPEVALYAALPSDYWHGLCALIFRIF